MGRVAICLVAAAVCAAPQAEVIERDLYYTLGPITGVFGERQGLGDNAIFFYDNPIVFDLGDTLVVNIWFDQRLEIVDVAEPTLETFSIGLNTIPGSPGFGGTWISSIEAIGRSGDVWSGPVTQGFIGGGAGFGWAANIEATTNRGSLIGIRWITTLTSVREGVPMTLTAFKGVSGAADGYRKLPLAVTLDIDVQPGSSQNNVNPGSQQMVVVAVLTSEQFDASQVDPQSVEFGPGKAPEAHGRVHLDDVDGDGDIDAVLHFKIAASDLQCEDRDVLLSGKDYGGQPFVGTDEINPVGCRQ